MTEQALCMPKKWIMDMKTCYPKLNALGHACRCHRAKAMHLSLCASGLYGVTFFLQLLGSEYALEYGFDQRRSGSFLFCGFCGSKGLSLKRSLTLARPCNHVRCRAQEWSGMTWKASIGDKDPELS